MDGGVVDSYWGRHRAPSPTDESRAWPERYARMGWRPWGELWGEHPKGAVTLALGSSTDYAPALLRGWLVAASLTSTGGLDIEFQADHGARIDVTIYERDDTRLMWKEGLA